jgi:hypothetical protein
MSAMMSAMHVDDPGDPAVIARRFDSEITPEALAKWCGGHLVLLDGRQCVKLPGEAGSDTARPGDWIVRVGEGVFVVVGPDEFAARFEPISTDEVT